MSNKIVRQVVVTDGSPLALATAIVCMAYNLPHGEGTADKLVESLGLADTPQQTTDFETAYSYPNAVCLTQDEKDRMTVYLFDSRQETEIRDGEPLPGLVQEPEKEHGQTKAEAGSIYDVKPTVARPGLLSDDELPEGVVPGQTPGWPADQTTGRALRLTDEQRQRIIDTGSLGESDGTMAEGVSAEQHAERDEFKNGYDGFTYAGQSIEDNPHPAGSALHEAWSKGYRQGEADKGKPDAEKTYFERTGELEPGTLGGAEMIGDDDGEGDGVNEESDDDVALRNAYNEGVDAHNDELTDGDNPYNAETQRTLHDEWARGLSEGGDATKAE